MPKEGATAMQNDVSAAIAGSAAMAGVPTPAQVVVIGHGIVGASLVFHLAARRQDEVVPGRRGGGAPAVDKVQRSLVADRPFAPPYEPNAKPLVPALVVGSSGPEETA
jgi:hypothetical protein